MDRFAEDPANGKATDLAAGQTLTWNFSQNIDPPGPNGIFNMGFTGLMSNNTASYLSLYDPANIKPGGAAAGFQIELVPDGDALIQNSQQNGFQFGIDVQAGVTQFVIETKIDNPFGGSPSTAPVNFKSQGFFIGTGDQDNYLKIVAAANNGAGGIEVVGENAGASSSNMYAAAITGSGIQALDTITLRLTVDVATGVATPDWTYTVDGSAFNGAGAPVQLSGATLTALQGGYSVGGLPSALAVGIISTSAGSGQPFSAFWQSIEITAQGGSRPPAGVAVTQSGGTTAVTEGGATDSLSIALSTQPTANVSVTLAGNPDVTVGGQASTTLTFTPTNWNVAQNVTVAAVNDTAAEGPESANITFSTASSDTKYNNLAIAPVSVSITDNDQAPPPNSLQARLSVTPGSALNASTFSGGAFQLENLSTGGQELTSVTIDLSGSLLAGMVFDPAGAAGDTVAKDFTIDNTVGSFTVTGVIFGNGSSTAGYKTLTLQLQGFGPGETLGFSVDVDPASIQGVGCSRTRGVRERRRGGTDWRAGGVQLRQLGADQRAVQGGREHRGCYGPGPGGCAGSTHDHRHWG